MHLTTTTFKQIIQILAIGFLLSACGGSSGGSSAEQKEVVEASDRVLAVILAANDGNRSSIVSIEDLEAILPPLTGVSYINLAAYQTYIEDPLNSFSTTDTRNQVQAMVTAVESNRVLTKIGEENNKGNESNVTIEELSSITDPLTGIKAENLLAYREYISNPDNPFSDIATRDQVQIMIAKVNASQVVLARIQTGTAGITIEELVSILPQRIGIVDDTAHELAYQAYITDSNNTFTSANILNEVQTMIGEVNASQAVLEQIGEDDDDANQSDVTVEELESISSIRDVNEAYESAYQEYIADPANNFDNPATRGQVQMMIDTVNARPRPLPKNMTITKSNLLSFITSINDNNIDTQGVIDMNVAPMGLLVKVPYRVVSSPVTLEPYSTSFTIVSSSTEDNESGIVATLAWDEQIDLPVGSATFDAYISIDDSNGSSDSVYNAKKLDIENNISGFTAASFAYPVSNGGDTGMLTLKVAPSIPDRMFGLADNTGNTESHNFLYLPVHNPTTGKIWLNNNLGATYANMNSVHFNPAQQATSFDDYLAYGSLFQWGRKADGHELISWHTNGLTGTAVHETTSTASNTDTPSHALFIKQTDWRNGGNDSLWANASSTNNPCPQGYRLPRNPNKTTNNSNEFYAESQSWDSQNRSGAVGSELVLPMSGLRKRDSGLVRDAGVDAYYWTGSVSASSALYMKLISSNAYVNSSNSRGSGLSVRCIKN